ncbi:MAG: hypothetical protein AB1560_12690 [Pseudomonadota bacterium]
MKSLEGLLGFAVLTGPMWLILLTLLIGIGIAVVVAKRLKQKSGKFVGIVGVFLILFLLLFGDEMAGKVYFNYLCATAARVKVYQTMELPAEYWEVDGKPKFFNQYGNLDHDLWVKKLDESGSHIERYSSVFAIDKDTSPVKERISQKMLGEVTTFRYWGGWMRRTLSPSNTANSCEFISAPGFSRSFYGQLFKPAELKGSGSIN